MTDKSEAECKFDGTCDLSKDGDISLKFDDGSSLLAHSFILTRASPIFKNMLEDCEHDGIIRLSNVSKDVWIEILRELYPGTHTFFLRQMTSTYDESVVSVTRYTLNSCLDGLARAWLYRRKWRKNVTDTTSKESFTRLMNS